MLIRANTVIIRYKHGDEQVCPACHRISRLNCYFIPRGVVQSWPLGSFPTPVIRKKVTVLYNSLTMV
jgi:hypothetical protein